MQNQGAIVVSAFALSVNIAALIIAYLAKNDTLLNVVIGAASANGTAVIQYWVGSSVGSARKDQQLAALAAGPTELPSKVDVTLKPTAPPAPVPPAAAP